MLVLMCRILVSQIDDKKSHYALRPVEYSAPAEERLDFRQIRNFTHFDAFHQRGNCINLKFQWKYHSSHECRRKTDAAPAATHCLRPMPRA